jgi:ATPase subunit of ABC transporter with duplicated ATPase domains
MLAIEKLEMQFGGQLLFTDVNLNLRPKARYGLLGANGSGKSTLLKILGQLETPAGGKIILPPDSRVGFLKQDHYRYENDLIIEVVMQGNERLWQAMHERNEILKQDELADECGMRLAELEMVIAEEEGYSAEARAHRILNGLGIDESQHFETMSALSGGYKLRVLLAQVLFAMPDVLLLDEPTNHLDIVAIHWLEKYLVNDYKGVLIVISHDQAFIDNIATDILDIDYQTVTHYKGNYSDCQETKAAAEEAMAAQDRNIAARTADLKEFVTKFKAKASKAKQAQSKMKQIERLEKDRPSKRVSSRRAPYFDFKQKHPSGKNILKAKDISKSYDDHRVLNKVTFNMYAGDKIGIIGPNGIGKSTLLKILMKQLDMDKGEFDWGQKLVTGYFPQDHYDAIDKTKQPLPWLEGYAGTSVEKDLYQALGKMLFSRDDAQKHITDLSGGETARLLFAGLMLQHPNLLVLDEPTNHLDLESINALAEALNKYDGSVLLVSHNRHFLKHCCNRVILLSDQGLTDYREHSLDDIDAILDECFELA